MDQSKCNCVVFTEQGRWVAYGGYNTLKDARESALRVMGCTNRPTGIVWLDEDGSINCEQYSQGHNVKQELEVWTRTAF